MSRHEEGVATLAVNGTLSRSLRKGSARLSLLPISEIRPRGDQPRKSMDREALAELTESVRQFGILQPIRVRPVPAGGYEIVAGERRWVAAQSAGLTSIPALIVEATDDRAYLEALIENIQREDLNPVDRAQALKRLRVNLGSHSWDEVAQVVGITRRHIYHLLNVVRLPAALQEDLRAGDLTEKHARALSRLRSQPLAQEQLWSRIHADGMSGEDALRLARELRAAPTRRPAGDEPPPAVEGAEVCPLLIAAQGLDAALDAASPDEITAAVTVLAALALRIASVLPGGA